MVFFSSTFRDAGKQSSIIGTVPRDLFFFFSSFRDTGNESLPIAIIPHDFFDLSFRYAEKRIVNH